MNVKCRMDVSNDFEAFLAMGVIDRIYALLGIDDTYSVFKSARSKSEQGVIRRELV
jgi:hypothetical protein